MIEVQCVIHYYFYVVKGDKMSPLEGGIGTLLVIGQVSNSVLS